VADDVAELPEARCPVCDRLLFHGHVSAPLEIKCGKCSRLLRFEADRISVLE
jgi:phage FluMu protein Com